MKILMPLYYWFMHVILVSFFFVYNFKFPFRKQLFFFFSFLKNNFLENTSKNQKYSHFIIIYAIVIRYVFLTIEIIFTRIHGPWLPPFLLFGITAAAFILRTEIISVKYSIFVPIGEIPTFIFTIWIFCPYTKMFVPAVSKSWIWIEVRSAVIFMSVTVTIV